MTATKTKKSVIAWIEVKTTDLLRAVEMALTFAEGRTSPIHDCVLIQLKHDENDNTSALVVNKFDGSSWVRSLVPMIGASQNSHEFAIPARSLKDFLKRISRSIESVLIEASSTKVKITDGQSIKYEVQVQSEAYPDPPSASQLSQVDLDIIKLINEGSASVTTGMETQSIQGAILACCDLIMWQDGTSLKASAFSVNNRGFSLCDQGDIENNKLLFQHNIAGGVADEIGKLAAAYGPGAIAYIGKTGNYLVVEIGTDDAFSQIFSLTVNGDSNRYLINKLIPSEYVKATVDISRLMSAIEIVQGIHDFCILTALPNGQIAVVPRIYSTEDAEIQVACDIKADGIEFQEPKSMAVFCELVISKLKLVRQYGNKAVIKFRITENAPPLLLIEPEAETVGRRLHLVIGAKDLGSRVESVIKESGK